jgi:sterol desaturase/sphingolipid hydroxylase (fatty acid hydroxylase superfamily)
MRGRWLVSVSFFPMLIIAGLAAALGMQRAGISDYAIVFSLTFFGSLPILLLQRLMPYEPEWRGRPIDFRIDILHMVVSNALSGSLVRAIAYGVVCLMALWIEQTIGRPVWPDSWPILAQLALAVLIGDFFSYWAHRLCHSNTLMWRIHALHHSSERMYVFASARNHPLNVMLTYVALTCPVVLLGASPEVMALHSVFNSLVGMLQHSNVDLRTGPLGWILATPELHRWHHSNDREESAHNFGTDTAIWDILFGTRHLPSDRKPRVVGLPGVAIPSNFLKHMVVPFVYQRFVLVPALARVLTERPAPPRLP